MHWKSHGEWIELVGESENGKNTLKQLLKQIPKAARKAFDNGRIEQEEKNGRLHVRFWR